MNVEIIASAVNIVIAAALFFVWVVRYDNIVEEFKNDYNYPDWLRDLTGILKLSCAAMLLSADPQMNNLGLLGVDVFCHDDTRKGEICTKKGVAVNISFFALPVFIVCLASRL
jgi:tellurite resistance protein TehA-like permease